MKVRWGIPCFNQHCQNVHTTDVPDDELVQLEGESEQEWEERKKGIIKGYVQADFDQTIWPEIEK
jgi:hypothetical protein